jgi:hypothetical protein
MVEGLEKEWRNKSPRLTERELLELFPEAKEFIFEKIEELKMTRERLVSLIKKKLQIIRQKSKPENQWFWEEVVKVEEGWDLLKAERQLARLQRLISTTRGQEIKGKITEEKIRQASLAPIEIIANGNGIKLRKSGRSLVGLCPFHQERTPSFFIYPETNSFYCYGCQKGGNIITFVKLLYSYSFKETVEFLSNNY